MTNEKCAVCGVPAGQRCAGCQQVTYCGRDHQRQHWKDAHRNECRCYKVIHNPVLGRHLVATRAIRKGETIYRDEPLVLGPKMASSPMCLGCNRNLAPRVVSDARKEFYCCRRCRWPLCGPSCEAAPNHTEECRLLSSSSYRPQITFHDDDPHRKESAYCVIVPLRAILLKRKDSKRYTKLLTLQSHIESRIDTPLYGVLKHNLVPFIRNILGMQEISETEILHIAGIMDTNSYEIRAPEKDIKIRALYELGAMMSHNCRPNTKHYFDQKLKLVLVATVDIPKDEVISISYTQPLQATIQRRYAIKQAKCFECCCDRCKDPTEFQTYTGAIICPNCAKAKVVAVDPLSFRSNWQCEDKKCSYRETAQENVARNETFRATILGLPKDSPDGYERFLEANGAVLHPWNTNMLQVKYALVQLYGSKLKGFSVCDLTESQLWRKVNLCIELLKVADWLEPGLSTFRAKLLIQLRDVLLVLREQIGLQFDSTEVCPLSAGRDARTSKCQTKGEKNSPKNLPPPGQTLKQLLESSQREIDEMIKSDPTLKRE
ncbi:SET domain-containing protein SmydA-8 [Toxorhynchites rutilus septentrionalis]|uniref:SET domain-containing protein SmydA-8 n=1 Tax=Toxorhynchites rutilus septentrionalis TaxID=329112 RepID=UPI00247AC491|nr:SET domain-containing protein SmydA-8 [Toxorhynchites rutilus septentrionalis]